MAVTERSGTQGGRWAGDMTCKTLKGAVGDRLGQRQEARMHRKDATFVSKVAPQNSKNT